MARVELPLVLTALCLTMTSSDPGDLRPRTPEEPAGRLGAAKVRSAATVGVRRRLAATTVRRPEGPAQMVVLVSTGPVVREAHRPLRATRGS